MIYSDTRRGLDVSSSPTKSHPFLVVSHTIRDTACPLALYILELTRLIFSYFIKESGRKSKKKDFKVDYERLTHDLKDHPKSERLEASFENSRAWPNLRVLP